MVDIVRLYVFDGIEHTNEDDERVLWDDAEVVIEKLTCAPIAVALKTRNPRHENKPEYEEIFDIIKSTGKYNIIKECQTLNLAKVGD